MNLEEDAMLVAIGRMSMDEAREKWADQWSDFIKALSRWKSIHQLLRLGRLNATMETLAAGIDDAQQRIAKLNEIRSNVQSIQSLINWQASQIYFEQQLAQDARERFRRKGKQPEDVFGFDATPPEYAPTTHRGKKHYQDHVRYAIEAATWDVYGMLDGGGEDLKQLNEEYEHNKRKLKEATENIDKENKGLATQRAQMEQLKDEIDITKPYAMGLLVADIFYSLAAALQGDNY